jgi:hypothetical protein
MTSYRCVFEFTPKGLAAFKRVFLGELVEGAFSPTDSQFAIPVAGTKQIVDDPVGTAKELAQRVIDSLGGKWDQFLSNEGMWAWLTFVLRDVLFPKDAEGKRNVGELWRWYPSDPGDYQKAQRHLVRMPVVLLGSFGDKADHLLCGKPQVLSDVREQLVGQQDMLTTNFQAAARLLYYNDETATVKRGAGGKGRGSSRRLRDLRKQLDVTWNIFDLEAKEILTLLPKEFDRFQPPSS